VRVGFGAAGTEPLLSLSSFSSIFPTSTSCCCSHSPPEAVNVAAKVGELKARQAWVEEEEEEEEEEGVD